MTLTNEQIYERVVAWQTAGFIHELTCRKDSSHAPLIPVELDGVVRLMCVDCGYVQHFLPSIIMAEGLLKWIEFQKKGLEWIEFHKKR